MGKIKELQIFPKPLLSNITNSQRSIAISLPSVQTVLGFLLEKSGFASREAALHFVGEKKISRLHKQFFDDPSVTDCITFPYEEKDFLGEIFICPKTAYKYAKAYHLDLYTEITLYLVHGFLHLLGYDDQTPSQQKQMRLQEKKWMTLLKKNNLQITP